jgi:hypothetical protein
MYACGSLLTTELLAGTEGWFPPEQVQFVDPTTDRLADTGKLGDASNAWAIGAIIMRLMNLEKNPKQPRYVTDVRGEMEPQLNAGAKKYYSKGLCALVNECVRFRTYDRTALPDLWDRIQRYTGETPAKYDPDDDGDNEGGFDDMQNAIREQKYGDGDDDDYSLEYRKEKYKIGLARNKDEGQGNEDLDDDNQHAGGLGDQDSCDEDLGGMKDLDEFLEDDMGGAKLSDANLGGVNLGGGVFPGGRVREPIDEEYDDVEDSDPDK